MLFLLEGLVWFRLEEFRLIVLVWFRLVGFGLVFVAEDLTGFFILEQCGYKEKKSRQV